MKYDILTDTAFFRAAQNGDIDGMTANYGNFIDKVIEVCGCTDGKTVAFATLDYTDIFPLFSSFVTQPPVYAGLSTGGYRINTGIPVKKRESNRIYFAPTRERR